jgi:hypothetical protein
MSSSFSEPSAHIGEVLSRLRNRITGGGTHDSGIGTRHSGNVDNKGNSDGDNDADNDADSNGNNNGGGGVIDGVGIAAVAVQALPFSANYFLRDHSLLIDRFRDAAAPESAFARGALPVLIFNLHRTTITTPPMPVAAAVASAGADVAAAAAASPLPSLRVPRAGKSTLLSCFVRLTFVYTLTLGTLTIIYPFFMPLVP